MTQTLSPVRLPEYQQLPSGCGLYTLHNPQAPRQSLLIAIQGGNRLESVAGLADLVDNLLMQGTSKRNAESIAIEIDDIPVDIDFDTHRDFSSVSLTFLPEDLERAMALVSELLFDSTLADFEKEKTKMIGEIAMQLDSPQSLSKDLMYQTAYKNTPYRSCAQNMQQSLPTINSITPLTEHYKKVVQPANMVITAIGPIAADKLSKTINGILFAGATGGQCYANNTPVDFLTIPQNQYVTAAKDDSQQLHLFQAFAAPQFTHPDYAPMAVLNTILGGAGLSSRLFIEIRDKQGLAYNVRSGLEGGRYFGLMVLYVGTEPKNRQRVIDGFAEELRKLVEIPLTPDELTSTKQNILGRQAIALERTSQQVVYYGAKLAVGATVEQIVDYPNKISAVTADDIQRVANRYLTQPSIISAVGPSASL